MVDISATFVDNNGDPVGALANAPTIEIRRTDTGAVVLASTAMTFAGTGTYLYTYAIPSSTEDYSFTINGDPTASGQVPDSQVTKSGGFSGLIDANESAIATNLDAAVSTRSTLTQADILSDATPFAGANINATIASRSTLTQADILSDATPFPGANINATIASRSTLTQADILSDATPFAGANVDAAVSTRAVPGDAMTLTAGERTAIDAELTGTHGAGAWTTADLTATDAALARLIDHNENARERVLSRDGAGRPLTAERFIYPDPATAIADTGYTGAGATARVLITVSYDGSGNWDTQLRNEA